MARVSSLLVLLTSALLAPPAAASKTSPVAPQRQVKRDLMTCEQTYGLGWTRCGQADSTFCYNPSEGQTCCADDSGYCDGGTYCAPVAGYCCVNGEDFGTCAENSGFALPTSLSSTWTTTVTRTTTVTLPRPTTNSSVQVLTASPGVITATVTCSAADATIAAQPTITAAANGTSSSTNSSTGPLASPSFVQASVAIKEQWTLLWTSLAMGVVGVFMTTC